MKKLSNTKLIGGLFLAASAFVITLIIGIGPIARAVQPTVDLGTAAPFAILAGTPNITDAGNTSVINGNVGLSPATGVGIGLFCSQVTGTIYSVDATGPLPCRVTDGPLLVTAKNNLTAAYTDAANRAPVTIVPTELGGTILQAGVYGSASTTLGITAGAGALTLDGQNNPSAVFIFQAPFSGTGLTVGNGSTISLINGAQACNVFWRVDTASIGTTANFVGTIMALNSISVANGATISGRLLARNGSVTLINDTIAVPTCAGNTTLTNTSNTAVIPGLPNTGLSGGQSSLWFVIPSSIVLAFLLLAYVGHKKHLI